jgi:hypothetical protein
MLDELAQYAARLEAARPNGGNQLAAFLMGLHNYARTHPGIASPQYPHGSSYLLV